MTTPRIPWTPEEDCVATEMHASGATPLQISRALGRRTADAVSNRLERLAEKLPSKKKSTWTRRPCIRCGRPFRSQGHHHRRCDRCTETISGMYYRPVSLNLP